LDQKIKIRTGIEKYLGYLTFFIGFPSILVAGINLSLFVFIILIGKFQSAFEVIRIKYTIHYIMLFFIIGTLVSVFDVDTSMSGSLERAMAVLPNYLYWALLVIVLVNMIKYLDLEYITKFLLFGVAISILFKQFKIDVTFLNPLSGNTYAFLMICFSTPCATYIQKKYGTLYSVVFILIVIASLLQLERRAGFTLIVLSYICSVGFQTIKMVTFLRVAVIALIVGTVSQLDSTERLIFDNSPRIHRLLYENDEVATTDESLLVRKAQIEKGLSIFADNPVTGIGLNNFSSYDVEIEGNFEGSEIVLRKEGLSEKSSHNSYINLLAEGGLLLLIPVLLMIIYNIYSFVVYYTKRTPLENSFYWSLMFCVIHLYFITDILNVFTWFMFGLVSAISTKYNTKMNQIL
jgi:O-antigen ligase